MRIKGFVLGLLLLLAEAGPLSCEDDYLNWKMKLNFSLSERGRLVDTIYEGVNVVVDDKDGGISAMIKRDGTFQGQNIRNMARFIKKGDVLANIGAHIGFQMMILGKFAGPQGKIYFFEPYPVTYGLLMDNIYLNDLEDISTCYQVAVSNKKQNGYILVTYINTSAAQIFTDESLAKNKIRYHQKIEVPIDLVDNVLPKDLKIDFALMDVERLEIEALQGMKEVMLRSPNLKIWIEWSGYSIHMSQAEYFQHTKDLLLWFQANGFKFYRIDKSGPKVKCAPKQHYIEMDAKTTYTMTEAWSARRQLVDLLITAANIDLNAFQ